MEIMKKLLVILAILSQFKAQSQPYIQMQAGNKNIGLSFGVQAQGGLIIDMGYLLPYSAANRPKIANLSIGKVINITNNDEDNFSITPSIGFAYLFYKDFSKQIDGINIGEFKPIYRLELAKDWYNGRLFISTNYAKDFFVSVGIKAFNN
jgi:hypothetical protein